MNRFIHLDNGIQDMYINVRAIFGVTQLDDDKICVELADGTTYVADQTLLPEITGENAVIQVLPRDRALMQFYGLEGIWGENNLPAYLAVMASGHLRPLDGMFNFMDIPGDADPIHSTGLSALFDPKAADQK